SQDVPSPVSPLPKELSVRLAVTRSPIHVDSALIHRLSHPDSADTLAFYHLRLEAERLRLLGGFDELLAPARSHIQIFEHQIRAAQIVMQRMGGRALLADEVGLGKTVEAGLILKEYILRGMVKKALILTPPSLVEQWREELADKFGLSAKAVDGSSPPDETFWAQEPLIVASLSLAKRDPHQTSILNQSFDLLIVDEAHHLRNRKTAAWKFVNQIKYKFILFLTATPIQNDLEEIYNLTTLLRPGQLGTPAQFSAQFKERGKPRTPKNPQALRDLLREVMVRHTRANTAVKLPRRVPHVLSVAMNEAERSAYQNLSHFIRRQTGAANMSPFVLTLLLREAGSHLMSTVGTLEKITEGCRPETRPTLQRLMEEIRSVPSHSKGEAFLKIIDHSDRCLIFTEFRETQNQVAAALRKAGHTVDLFHGGMNAAEKMAALQRFEQGTRCLVSTPTGGEGVNLQFCRTLINYDLPWNPMKIEQRIGRLHRFGQTGEVIIHSLAATQTVEHQLLRLLHEKLNLFELVVGETETILGDMLEEKDFEHVLMSLWLEAANDSDFEGRMEDWGRKIIQKKADYFQERRLDEQLFGADYERS
nr:DEAD/DEAH box helicase [Elusimicrobiota bacterium]